MTSYNGTLVSATNNGHSLTSRLIAAGVFAVALVGVMTLAEMLPAASQSAWALPPVQAAGVLLNDPSLPSAAKVFDGRAFGLEDSAPTI